MEQAHSNEYLFLRNRLFSKNMHNCALSYSLHYTTFQPPSFSQFWNLTCIISCLSNTFNENIENIHTVAKILRRNCHVQIESFFRCILKLSTFCDFHAENPFFCSICLNTCWSKLPNICQRKCSKSESGKKSSILKNHNFWTTPFYVWRHLKLTQKKKRSHQQKSNHSFYFNNLFFHFSTSTGVQEEK